jgi:hypothetical protein
MDAATHGPASKVRLDPVFMLPARLPCVSAGIEFPVVTPPWTDPSLINSVRLGGGPNSVATCALFESALSVMPFRSEQQVSLEAEVRREKAHFRFEVRSLILGA